MAEQLYYTRHDEKLEDLVVRKEELYVDRRQVTQGHTCIDYDTILRLIEKMGRGKCDEVKQTLEEFVESWERKFPSVRKINYDIAQLDSLINSRVGNTRKCDGCGQPIGYSWYIDITFPLIACVHMVDYNHKDNDEFIAKNPCLQALMQKHNINLAPPQEYPIHIYYANEEDKEDVEREKEVLNRTIRRSISVARKENRLTEQQQAIDDGIVTITIHPKDEFEKYKDDPGIHFLYKFEPKPEEITPKVFYCRNDEPGVLMIVLGYILMPGAPLFAKGTVATHCAACKKAIHHEPHTSITILEKKGKAMKVNGALIHCACKENDMDANWTCSICGICKYQTDYTFDRMWKDGKLVFAHKNCFRDFDPAAK
jgi:thiol-disulfide isomerase/thioredoxin